MQFQDYVSSEVLAVFRHCGWYEGRHVEMDVIRSKFSERGIRLHSASEWILSQLHGLTLKATDDPLCQISFDVPTILDWMNPDEPRFYQKLIDSPLCPIALSGSYMLLSEKMEVVFLADDWNWYTFVPNFNLAFESILHIDRTEVGETKMIPDELCPPIFRRRKS